MALPAPGSSSKSTVAAGRSVQVRPARPVRQAHTLFRFKAEPIPVRPPDSDQSVGIRRGGRRIRCPRCAWQPTRHEDWYVDEEEPSA